MLGTVRTVATHVKVWVAEVRLGAKVKILVAEVRLVAEVKRLVAGIRLGCLLCWRYEMGMEWGGSLFSWWACGLCGEHAERAEQGILFFC